MLGLSLYFVMFVFAGWDYRCLGLRRRAGGSEHCRIFLREPSYASMVFLFYTLIFSVMCCFLHKNDYLYFSNTLSVLF